MEMERDEYRCGAWGPVAAPLAQTDAVRGRISHQSTAPWQNLSGYAMGLV